MLNPFGIVRAPTRPIAEAVGLGGEKTRLMIPGAVDDLAATGVSQTNSATSLAEPAFYNSALAQQLTS
jgi:hypothetical protein